jgi:hypothetical protein
LHPRPTLALLSQQRQHCHSASTSLQQRHHRPWQHRRRHCCRSTIATATTVTPAAATPGWKGQRKVDRRQSTNTSNEVCISFLCLL